jgi:tetratricopeptide (TPR) repeat protein
MPARRPYWTLLCIGTLLLVAKNVGSSPSPADKSDTWTEVASPHFTVLSNDGERTARRIAQQFEQIRLVYSKALSRNVRLDPSIPIQIIASRNEKSLSEIIPEYWAQKGHMHPAGLFVPSPEKNYIALRTDVEGEFPYLTVYHEYVHLIIELNFQHIPVWLNEGYATFLDSATLQGKSGRLGQPNQSELYVLQQTKLLPLDLLFSVGHDSPYYNEAEKTNVFYAESWALTHYLMTDPARQKALQLGKYINLVENGDDPVEAARSAFGDLGQLKKELDSYVSRTSYTMYGVELPESADPKTFSSRLVPAAEADATLGEFDVSRGALQTARPKIEEAIKLDPNLALVQESMGLLLFREDKHDEAQKYLSRAVALDSKSALAYYLDGMLLVSGGSTAHDPAEAQAALEKAVALNPELAPAWDSLAFLYTANPENWNKALSASEHAVKAMPGDPGYRLNMAAVLLRMGKFEQARPVVQAVAKSADRTWSSRAETLLAQIDQAQQFRTNNGDRTARAAPSETAAAAVNSVNASDPERPAPVMRRRAQSDPAPEGASDSVSAKTTAPAESSTAARATHSYSMKGTIAAVVCSNAPQMQLTLQATGIEMHLHTADIAKIEVRLDTGHPPATTPPCAQFAGKKAKISYQLASQKPWNGEIVSVEF